MLYRKLLLILTVLVSNTVGAYDTCDDLQSRILSGVQGIEAVRYIAIARKMDDLELTSITSYSEVNKYVDAAESVTFFF